MKTLIVFATKHGFTRKCAGILRDSLDGESELWELGGQAAPDPTAYDQIVIGGAIYSGRPLPQLVGFLQKNKSRILEKRLALFVTSLSGKQAAQQYLTRTFPEEFLRNALRRSAFGGAIEWPSLSPWERWVLSTTKGIRQGVSNIDMTEIQAMAAELNKNQEKDPIGH